MELWFLFSAQHLKVPYISTKFHENISKGFKIIEDTISKGNNSVEMLVEL